MCHGIDWQNKLRTEAWTYKLKAQQNNTIHAKIEYLICNQRLILLFQTDTDISGSIFKFDPGKAS